MVINKYHAKMWQLTMVDVTALDLNCEGVKILIIIVSKVSTHKGRSMYFSKKNQV